MVMCGGDRHAPDATPVTTFPLTLNVIVGEVGLYCMFPPVMLIVIDSVTPQ